MEYIVNSVLNSITYILPVGETRECWLVDCGDIDKIADQGWQVHGVLLTHAHFDHIYGLNRLMDLFPDALIYTNAEGKEGLMNPKWNFSKYHSEVENFMFSKLENVRVIKRECTIYLDNRLSIEIMFSPGHEPSCLSYRIADMLFTGDAYIPGMKTVTTFPRSNKTIAVGTLEKLKELERSGLKIMPGHSLI